MNYHRKLDYKTFAVNTIRKGSSNLTVKESDIKNFMKFRDNVRRFDVYEYDVKHNIVRREIYITFLHRDNFII